MVWTVHDCWLYTGHCFYYSYAGCGKWQTGCGDCPQRREFPASWLVDRSQRNHTDKREAFTSVPAGRMVIVPVSEWIKSEMERSFLRGYDMRVIHNGINTETFRLFDAEPVKDRYHLKGRHILLGVASVWSREKGLDDFIRLSGMLNDNEVIVLVGVDRNTRSRLPKNIVGIGRTENIHQLAELYSAATALRQPHLAGQLPHRQPGGHRLRNPRRHLPHGGKRGSRDGGDGVHRRAGRPVRNHPCGTRH